MSVVCDAEGAADAAAAAADDDDDVAGAAGDNADDVAEAVAPDSTAVNGQSDGHIHLGIAIAP